MKLRGKGKTSVLLTAALLAAPSAAAAASPSLDQYVESVPSPKGPQRPTPASQNQGTHKHSGGGAARTGGGGNGGSGGSGGTGGNSTNGNSASGLPSTVQSALQAQGGSAASTLTKIATDPSRGAPQAAATGSVAPASTASPGALSAIIHGAGAGSGAQLPLLLLGLFAITAVSGAMALRSRARRS